jgi:hypothetical protein
MPRWGLNPRSQVHALDRTATVFDTLIKQLCKGEFGRRVGKGRERCIKYSIGLVKKNDQVYSWTAG